MHNVILSKYFYVGHPKKIFVICDNVKYELHYMIPKHKMAGRHRSIT